jgi:repressor LexA
MKSFTPERAESLYELYEFIVEYFNNNGFSPSIREILRWNSSLSQGTAQRYRKELVAMKCLKKIGKSTRTTKYVPVAPFPDNLRSLGSNKIQVVGIISAGFVTTTFNDDECAWIPVEGKIKEGDYALRVDGKSMIGASIQDGDIVWIRKVIDPTDIPDGQIVVARVDSDELTLKYFHLNGDQVKLKSANPEYKDQKFNIDRVEIQGYLLDVITSGINHSENVGNKIYLNHIDKKIKSKEQEIANIDITKLQYPFNTKIQVCKWNESKTTPYFKAVHRTKEKKVKYLKYLGKEDDQRYLRCQQEIREWRKLESLKTDLALLNEQRNQLLRANQ